MKHLLLSEIIDIIDGTIVSKTVDDPLINRIATRKSDRITNYTLVFFPHKSSVKDNLELKSTVIVTQRPHLFKDLENSFTIVSVKDSKIAYNKFIAYYRGLFSLDVIGITGTCGKTTTKEMVASILEVDRNIVKTILSRNSRFRNFKYLMEIDEKTDAAVIEVGVGFPGGIEQFANYFHPSIGVITNIGIDHVSGFKTHEAYIKEKAMMAKVLDKEDGILILNKDDQIIQKLDLRSFKGKILYFGLNKEAEIRASHIKYEEGGMKFYVHGHNGFAVCKINGLGIHNVYNALAALAVAVSLGIELRDAAKRLEKFSPVKSHLQLKKGINGSTIIDDTWNTNSKSIESALEVLSSISGGKKTIAVLGDIEELGAISESEHRKIGDLIIKYKIDQLITIGHESKYIAARALDLGMNPKEITILDDEGHLVEMLAKKMDTSTLVLIKKSMRNSFRSIRQLMAE
ncbi:Mur ligase family protein [Bacillus sp. FJAT-27445]|uniref:Mur ligase family protein n=1 Tax=Bacillus sp. FJAT-27445 TaxID=1679166 RepID=UPI000A9E16C3|nr:Mur ligase family protein [Bacillus sp. FJAT-27445]